MRMMIVMMEKLLILLLGELVIDPEQWLVAIVFSGDCVYCEVFLITAS